jgi:glutathione-specific gamma-glutamylcyclotransferase
MPNLQRKMALTPDLVARVHRVIEDTGPEPDRSYHNDDDYDAVVDELMASHVGEGLWLFAYGSLIWKPEVAFVEERPGTLFGWHRAFCLRLTRWRGTKERPGLMMALDRGGQCNGIAYRLEGPATTSLGKLVRREMSLKPPTNVPRWLPIRTSQRMVAAIAFVTNPKGQSYAGKRSLEDTADILAGACGHWGSCAEYLHQTVSHLEAAGIHDKNLWRLQALVAARISAMSSQQPG